MLRLAFGLLLAFGVSTFASEPPATNQGEPSIRIECHGKLRHGMVAIGGETTGSTIRFEGTTWELKLPDEASRTFAKEHHKQPITAVGTLRRVAGTEVPVRWIVDVERLSERNASTHKEGASLTVLGKLRACDAAAGESPKTVIEAAGIAWPLDLSSDAALPAKAQSLVGKSAVLTGRFELGSKAESPPRPIIRVNKLDAPFGNDLPK
ncbi:MAG: hypothetical protein AABP62_28455 [Planctomycetota bacterium]